MGDDDRQVIADWKSLMNMSVDELEKWLETDDSNDCGQIESDGEATGHKSGRCVLTIAWRGTPTLSFDAGPDCRGHV